MGNAKIAKASKVNRFTGKCYIANFEGDEIDGRRYAYGEEIDERLDAGTANYLVQNGRLTELSEGDPLVPALDAGSSIHGDQGRKAASSMTRPEMLSELAGDVPDHELRRAVEAKRQREDGGQAEDESAAAPAKGDAFEDLADANERAEAVKLMRKSETTLRTLADDEKVKGVEKDHDKADIVRLILAKRRDATKVETFDATAFVDRNLDAISDEELAGLSPENRAAVREAEGKREDGARSGLTDRLDKLDAA